MSIERNIALQADLFFADYRGAVASLHGVALIAEDLNHHPEWTGVLEIRSI